MTPDALHLAADAVERYQYERPWPTMPLDLHYVIDIVVMGDRGIVANIAMRDPVSLAWSKSLAERRRRWQEENPEEFERIRFSRARRVGGRL